MINSSAKSPNPDIETSLPSLLQLDDIRTKLSELRDQGLKALLGIPGGGEYSTPRPRWEVSDDAIERLLVRRTKHLAWDLGILPKDAREYRVPPPEHPDASSIFDSSGHSMPVFLAAEYLRTILDEPGKCLPRAVFICYYRLIRELYFIDTPDWTVGGARAGTSANGSARVSAFITCEIARALGFMRGRFQATAEFILLMYKLFEQVDKRIIAFRPPGVGKDNRFLVDKRWCDVELERILLSLRLHLERARSRILFELPASLLPEPGTASDKPDSIVKTITDCRERLNRLVIDFIAKTSDEATLAMSDINKHRKSEHPGRKLPATASPRDVHQYETRTRNYWLSEAAHFHAVRAIDDLRGRQGHDKRALRIVDVFDGDSAKKVSDWLQWGAGGVHAILEPTAQYAENVLNHAIAEHLRAPPVADCAEAVFAAASLGSIRGCWADPRFARAVGVLADSVDPQGVIPGSRPFHFVARGAYLSAANAHAIRAFAQILEHTPGSVSPQLLERFTRYFDVSAVSVEEGKRAWGRGMSFGQPVACEWTSAISILAIHRVIRMLDKKINEQVKMSFVVRGGRQLLNVPTIDDLMWTDLGITAVAKCGGRQRLTTTQYLELMRAHLAGPRAVASTGLDDVFSVVLYGPPGTGKTTLVESVARTHGTDLVYLSPSDFLVTGEEGVEKRSTAIMAALALLTETVVLFDEFDTVLHSRDSRPARPSGPLDFLPGSMLPKFASLHAAAKVRRIVYALATNFIERLDAAAVRPGRFNHRIAVLPPDVASRIYRLVVEIEAWKRDSGAETLKSISPQVLAMRVLQVAADSCGLPTVVLCKRLWLTAPKEPTAKGRQGASTMTPWDYITAPEKSPVKVDWPLPETIAKNSCRKASKKASLDGEGELPATQSAIEEALELKILALWEDHLDTLLKTESDVLATWNTRVCESLQPSGDEVTELIETCSQRIEEIRNRRRRLSSSNLFEVPHKSTTTGHSGTIGEKGAGGLNAIPPPPSPAKEPIAPNSGLP